jgi:sulfonate transport system substrate-binding protein
MSKISRRAFAAIIAVSALLPGGAYAADALKEIHIDWATYNPVSMILKQKGIARKGIHQGRHQHRLGAIGRLQQGA